MVVYTDGKVCISILHPPGVDEMSGELPEERWLPTQTVTTILLSIISLLSAPNTSSPANVDASVCNLTFFFFIQLLNPHHLYRPRTERLLPTHRT
jgi:ubiquitin-protein ligase